MKIVIDARESGTSTGRYIDRLIEYLYRLKPDFEIIVLTKANRLGAIRAMAPSFKVIESGYKEFSFAEQLGFWRQLRALKADLVHFPAAQQPILYRGKTITAILDLTTTRYRNPSKNRLVFWIKQQVYKWLVRYVARKSKKVITISQFVKDDIAKFSKISKNKISVTYPAAESISDKAEPLPALEKKQFIMYVGRPLPHKNLKRLVEAFSILQQSKPELQLVLAGKKDVLFDQIESWAAKKGIKNLIFTGFVSEGQLRWLYQNTAAYVFPSLSEGFGLPGLEAMVHGAPVVSSNATCLPEIYGDAAHYFDPKDVADMAQKISEVLDDKNLAESLIEKGRRQVKKYSWQRMAEQTLVVYRQILGIRE